jgi:chaperone required for assembly of F1-ATPase
VRRVYATVAVEEACGFRVTLDARAARTPARRPIVLPTRALAEAVAAEWRAQGETVEAASMPLTRLVGTALDCVAERREAVIDEVAGFAGTDLLCYRADPRIKSGGELGRRQQRAWQPVLDWAAERFDARLRVTRGVVPVAQDGCALGALRRAVAAYDDFALAALHAATAAAGSLLLALALVERRLDAQAVAEASELDEAFQVEQWGEDAEAAARRAALRAEIADAERLLALLRRG